MQIALLTAPLLQFNTPYPAVPMLTNAIKALGYSVKQYDLSLELTLAMFTPEFVSAAAKAARAQTAPSDALKYFIQAERDYARTITAVTSFLQGQRPELARRICGRDFLPEGPYFAAIDEEQLDISFGNSGFLDKAKHLASLYIDDLAKFFQEALDKDYALASYAEQKAIYLPDFQAIIQRLQSTSPTEIEKLIDNLAQRILNDCEPDIVGISIPFPGTVFGAFRLANAVRRLSPKTKIVIGGGYVNSELRSLNDKRVFDYVDYICYDQGVPAWTAILRGTLKPSKSTSPQGNAKVMVKEGLLEYPDCNCPALLVPDYGDLPLDKYMMMAEMPSPLQNIWSEQLWLKMQLTYGCPWHRCKFCDLDLDYISTYAAPPASEIVDAMEKLSANTGRYGFHFTDEALAPELLQAISQEILNRDFHPMWWGNVRFDRKLTPELLELMADAGCVAITGGLECAEDRLLQLMNKGITLDSATRVFKACKKLGIMVHAYLMYGFPTETRAEVASALKFVAKCFKHGLLQSAYWHRFALTVHSPIAKAPQDFGIELLPPRQDKPRFAQNEIPFRENNAPDWDKIGPILAKATYNYMLGLGFDYNFLSP